MRIDRPDDFGHVALVMGGDGAERQVSLDGGQQILAALQAANVTVTAVDGIPALLDLINRQKVDRVFNILHGRGGEDGALQGALQCLGVPVTGSGVRGSAVSMDKTMSKSLWRQSGLPTADWVEIQQPEAAADAVGVVGFPLVVKPVSEGSSVGITLVREPSQLSAAVATAFRHQGRVMLERMIEGSEITIGLLADQALPAIKIVPARDFYDYEAKYVDSATRYLCPCGLPDEVEQNLADMARHAFDLLGASGWGRVDFLCDADGSAWLLEANTTPGMTSHSLVPKAAARLGINFQKLVWRILETSFQERC